MNECIFCRIVSGKIPTEKVFENGTCVAFLDARPRAPGHTMVITKRHVENFTELPQELVAPLFETAQKVTKLINKSLKPDGFTYGINQGKVSGQEVPHLHFHIVPRWLDDGGHSFQCIVDNPPKEELAVIAQKIRNAA